MRPRDLLYQQDPSVIQMPGSIFRITAQKHYFETRSRNLFSSIKKILEYLFIDFLILKLIKKLSLTIHILYIRGSHDSQGVLFFQ